MEPEVIKYMQNKLSLINPVLLESTDVFSIEVTDPVPNPIPNPDQKKNNCCNTIACIFIFFLFIGCIVYIFLVL